MSLLTKARCLISRRELKSIFTRDFFLMQKVSMGESMQEVSLLAFVLIKGAEQIQ